MAARRREVVAKRHGGARHDQHPEPVVLAVVDHGDDVAGATEINEEQFAIGPGSFWDELCYGDFAVTGN
jgi:hypothetical protein